MASVVGLVAAGVDDEVAVVVDDEAVVTAGALGVAALPARQVGYRCEYDDVLGHWSELREIGDGGCLLIRPDQHIAFRSADLADQPLDTLRAALTRVLALTAD